MSFWNLVIRDAHIFLRKMAFINYQDQGNRFYSVNGVRLYQVKY